MAAGAVACSSRVSQIMADSRESPHISADGRSPPQNPGRSGRPNTAQRMSGNNCAHRCPAGLPSGMPGKGEVMDGAMQQAPQPARQVGSDLLDTVKVQRQMPTIKNAT
ncbi:hypothetical protein CBA19C6_03480 [Cupriavidus pauculus]|nr:hypothetical protein CBA19C6_03480 [Cupriavidus pauculus]